MHTIKIHKATPADLQTLQTISILTFQETFADHNTQENMQNYLSEGFSIHQLTAELNNQHSEFYLATSGNETIGYLKINTGPSQTELKENRALEIERIYVLKQFHGKNIGQQLYHKALQIAQQHHAEYIWLGVWEKNPRAIRFYQKNGLTAFDKHIFKLGDDEQTDIMMKLKL